MLRVFQKLICRVVIVGVIVFLATILLIPSARAITLIPPTLELGLTPGQPLKTVVKLFNETSGTIELYTEVRSFSAKGETGQPSFNFNTESIGLSTWVDMETGPIILAPGERYEVPVIITPPTDADPGGHYAAICFT